MRLYVWTIACALTACDVEQDAMFLPDAQIEDAESDDSRDRGMNPPATSNRERYQESMKPTNGSATMHLVMLDD